MRRVIKLLYLAALGGCSLQPNLWVADSIAAGSQEFDSSRLRYCPQEAPSPLTFEMVKMGEQIEAFLSLKRSRFKEGSPILVTIAGETFKDSSTVHEGKMRLRLSEEMTQRIIQALQTGTQVSIVVGEFEEELQPEQFAPSFDQFKG